METHFNVQRRLYDYQFSLSTTPLEFEQAHQAFMELYNTTPIKDSSRTDVIPIPLVVLGEAKAALYARGVDPEVFARAVSPYDEPVWLCHPQLSLLCGARGAADAGLALGLRGAVAGGVGQCRLSRIPLQVDWRTRKVTEIRDGVFYPRALPRRKARSSAHAPGVIGVVSPSGATAAGTSPSPRSN